MRFLTMTDKYPTTFKCCRFAGAAVKADPDVAMFAPGLVAPVATLKGKIASRQEAEDLIADAQGAVTYRERLLREAVLAISRKVFAHYGSRTAPDYLKILPKAGSDINALQPVERAKAVAALVDALAEKGLPPEFAPLGKNLAVAQKGFEVAAAQVVTAELGASKAKTAENDARTAVVTAYRALHAQLTLKFPNDKARVEGYFWSPTVKKSAKTPTPAT